MVQGASILNGYSLKMAHIVNSIITVLLLLFLYYSSVHNMVDVLQADSKE